MTKRKVHTRAHIRLNNQAEVLSFIQELCRNDDSFSIENKHGDHRINAKSVIGVMYTMVDFPDEMYLVNDTHDGRIPSFVAYTVLSDVGYVEIQAQTAATAAKAAKAFVTALKAANYAVIDTIKYVPDWTRPIK